ncbi:MAG: hypothetical protein AVDCRST_MAG68-3094, partial [uncultured Gemmatimonadetes bacterium]
ARPRIIRRRGAGGRGAQRGERGAGGAVPAPRPVRARHGVPGDGVGAGCRGRAAGRLPHAAGCAAAVRGAPAVRRMAEARGHPHGADARPLARGAAGNGRGPAVGDPRPRAIHGGRAGCRAEGPRLRAGGDARGVDAQGGRGLLPRRDRRDAGDQQRKLRCPPVPRLEAPASRTGIKHM